MRPTPARSPVPHPHPDRTRPGPAGSIRTGQLAAGLYTDPTPFFRQNFVAGPLTPWVPKNFLRAGSPCRGFWIRYNGSMPTRLKRLISPNDTDAQELGKLTEALVAGLDNDIRPQVVATAADTPATAEEKWRRAVTEGLAAVMSRASGGAAQYVHHQDTPSSTWNIRHNLSGFPAVAVVDSANRSGIGHLIYVDHNSLRVEFSAGFSGKAYLVL